MELLIGFFCLIIGYAIGLSHNQKAMEKEIKLRKDYEALCKGIINRAKESGYVHNLS